MLRSADRPRIPSPWRIRNDGAQTIIYRCATDQLKFKVCSPLEASLVPFLSGAFTTEQVFDAWSNAVRGSGVLDGPLTTIFERTLGSLEGGAGLILAEGAASPSFGDDDERYFPDFRAYRRAALRLQRPLAVNVAMTHRCACDCVYCYAERKRTPEVGLDRLRSLFDELAANEIFLVDIAGGDLFVRDDALSILEEMVKRDFVFFLSTKSHISRDAAQRLRELGIGTCDAPGHLQRVIQVSIDTVDPAVAASLTGNPRFSERTSETVVNLVSVGLAPRIKCVLTGLNHGAPEALVDRFVRLGVRAFQFVQYGRTYYRHREELFLRQEQKLELRDAIRRLRESHPEVKIDYEDRVDGVPSRKPPRDWQERALCSGGRISMLIQPNGDVTLCDQIPHAEPFVVGNAFSDGVMGVWRSERLEAFLYPDRQRFAGAVCAACPDFDACHREQGYCYRDALFHYGSAYEAPPDCPRQTKPPLRAQ